MKLVRIAVIAFSTVVIPVVAHAGTICPALTGASSSYYAGDTTASSNCNTIITFNANGTTTITFPNANPYDGNDDDYVGVINNTGKSFSSFGLSGSSIYGFDGDGIDAYGITGNSIDLSDYGSGAYGGTDAYYTNVSSSLGSGTINFIGGIAAGGTGYFSLEDAPGSVTITTTAPSAVPEPSSLVLLGTGVLGLAGAVRRKLLA